MSTDKRHVLARVPSGDGWALDLGGGAGTLRGALVERGYRYANLDLAPDGRGAVRGDAHRAPFRDGSLSLIVSSDSLEHFPDPRTALAEARRMLDAGGTLVIWVPFLHPFHGDDFYRYTPLGLRTLLSEAGFLIDSLEAPLWVTSVMAQAFVEVLRRIHLGSLEKPIEKAAAWIDGRLARFQGSSLSFAEAYLVVARPEG